MNQTLRNLDLHFDSYVTPGGPTWQPVVRQPSFKADVELVESKGFTPIELDRANLMSHLGNVVIFRGMMTHRSQFKGYSQTRIGVLIGFNAVERKITLRAAKGHSFTIRMSLRFIQFFTQP